MLFVTTIASGPMTGRPCIAGYAPPFFAVVVRGYVGLARVASHNAFLTVLGKVHSSEKVFFCYYAKSFSSGHMPG